MSYRIHTADAVFVATQTGTDAEIDAALGGYEHGRHGGEERLVLNDAGNQEAWVITGTREEIKDLLRRALDLVSS